MKASELITALEALVKEHGDLPVVLHAYRMGAFGHFDASGASVQPFNAHHSYNGELDEDALPPPSVVVLDYEN